MKVPDLDGIQQVDDIMQHNPSSVIAVPLDSFAAFAGAFGQSEEDVTASQMSDSSYSDYTPSYDTGTYDNSDPSAGYIDSGNTYTDSSGTVQSTPAGPSIGSTIGNAFSNLFTGAVQAATPAATGYINRVINPVRQGLPPNVVITGPTGGVVSTSRPAAAAPTSMTPLLLGAAAVLAVVLLAGGGKKGA
jgi:hypothetical protein